MVPGALQAKKGKSPENRTNTTRPATDTSKVPAVTGAVLLFGAGPLSDDGIVRMIHMAGGRGSRFVVVSVAAGQQTALDAVRAFTRYGCKHVDVVELISRERADDPAWCEQVSSSDAVLLVGDDPGVARQILVDTRCKATLESMLGAGKIVAGAGGGAMVLCDQMVVDGSAEVLAGGTALVGRIILAASGSQESFVKLLQAVGSFQGSLYLGAALSRGSGLLIHDSEARVIGEGSVTMMDARDCMAVGLGEDGEAPPEAAGVICGLKVHHLAPGYGLNLRSRRPLGPEKPATPAAGE